MIELRTRMISDLWRSCMSPLLPFLETFKNLISVCSRFLSMILYRKNKRNLCTNVREQRRARVLDKFAVWCLKHIFERRLCLQATEGFIDSGPDTNFHTIKSCCIVALFVANIVSLSKQCMNLPDYMSQKEWQIGSVLIRHKVETHPSRISSMPSQITRYASICNVWFLALRRSVPGPAANYRFYVSSKSSSTKHRTCGRRTQVVVLTVETMIEVTNPKLRIR